MSALEIVDVQERNRDFVFGLLEENARLRLELDQAGRDLERERRRKRPAQRHRGIGPIGLALLRYLLHEPATVEELAGATGHPRRNTHVALERLRYRGLVDRDRPRRGGPAGAAPFLYELTEAGRRAARRT